MSASVLRATRFARCLAACGLFLAIGWTAACDNDDKDSDENASAAEGSRDAAMGEGDSATDTDNGGPVDAEIGRHAATDEGGTATDADNGGPVDGLLIGLDDGEVQGEMAGEARRFLKIPYAKPPLGELRWKAPVRNDPWTGVLHETEFAQGCAQLEDQGAPASDNEDCLYLNVWSPEPAPDRAPVMVWIHGGGNFSGAADIPVPSSDVLGTEQLWFDGQFFASRNGIVLVTINYRLGPLGFFAHPGLADEGEPMGNQGLRDQRLALQWVRDNIAKFGGDPDNVTIFGESAGAADVCYHLASPGSRGLFHRAIGQSGGCTVRSVGPEQDTGDARAQMQAYGEAVGCPIGEGQLDCLREVPIPELLANADQPAPGAGEVLGERRWSFAPVLDGSDGFLPDTPRALFDRGKIADVPYLLGTNNDEGTTLVWRADSLTSEEQYMADLQARYGDAAEDVAAMYPPSDFDGDYDDARARVVGDASLFCSTHDTARRAARAGLTVFVYNFNVAWSLLPTVLLAGHAAEISHVFGKPFVINGQDPAITEQSQAVADAMNDYWARFAATGDPNGSGAPAVWPRFDADDDKRLQLDPDWEVLENFRSEECAFWREYYGVE